MFFTYWQSDDPDERGLSIQPMIGEWQREFGTLQVYGDAEVVPLLGRWGRDLFGRIRIPTCKSDVARLVLLHELGGFYLDAHTGFGNRDAMRLLIARLPESEVLLLDMTDEHDFAGDVGIHSGAIYSRPQSPVLRALIDRAFSNLEQQAAREYAAGGYSPYDLWSLTGAGVILGELFDMTRPPYRLVKFTDRIRIYPLKGDETDPIRFYQHYQYRRPGKHWSERQRYEPLFW